MMKKLLFLIAGGALSFSASAQNVYTGSVVLTKQEQAGKQVSVEEMKQLTSWKNDSRATGKNTIAGTRTYNYVELLSALATPAQTLPYLWQNGEGMGVYTQQGGGLGIDTIANMGFGAVLHPWHGQFNDKFALDYAGKVAIENFSTYIVDTVAIYGYYRQNSAKTAVVDTLRVTLIYGNGGTTDVPISNWWSNNGSFKNNFGYDTLRIPNIEFDSAARAPMGTNRIVKNIPMDINWKYDTLANGFNRFAIPFGTTIPAGNLVGCFAYFISGDPNKPAPYTDTIFRGNSVPGLEAFKFNMMRPLFYGERDAQYPKYTPGNFNTGYMLQRIYDPNSALYNTYIPQYFWNPEANIEHPYMDWVVTCNDCNAVSVANINEAVTSMKVYPNPATNETKVSFDMGKATNVKVSMSNLVGQVISSQDFNNVTSGVATFATSQLANGVYVMSVEADGFKKVERVTVAH